MRYTKTIWIAENELTEPAELGVISRRLLAVYIHSSRDIDKPRMLPTMPFISTLGDKKSFINSYPCIPKSRNGIIKIISEKRKM